jgi:hypothetical protein
MLSAPPGGALIPSMTAPSGANRGLMMPGRKRTRAQDRRYRISYERRINETRIAEQRRQRQAWLAATYEPPPF